MKIRTDIIETHWENQLFCGTRDLSKNEKKKSFYMIIKIVGEE